MTLIKCIACGLPKMTWADQRRQYGRAIRKGLTPDEAKRIMPRCQKCMTEFFGDQRHVARVPARDEASEA
jgi:hypothetical protein